MSKHADSVVRIPCSLNSDFFNYWLEFLLPFHNLTPRELLVAAALLRKRLELSKYILEDDILDNVLLSDSIKKQLMKELSINPAHFNAVILKLKMAKILINDRVNKRFIPNISPGSNDFKLMLYFEFKDES